MHHYNELCIRLFSELFPCPWMDILPDLKAAKERLEAFSGGLDTHFPNHLKEALEFCQECVSYEPVSVYRRGEMT